MRKHKAMVAIGAALLLVTLVRQPHADIRILTHDIGDATPGRVQAAVDLGVGAVSLLVTWSRSRPIR